LSEPPRRASARLGSSAQLGGPPRDASRRPPPRPLSRGPAPGNKRLHLLSLKTKALPFLWRNSKPQVSLPISSDLLCEIFNLRRQAERSGPKPHSCQVLCRLQLLLPPRNSFRLIGDVERSNSESRGSWPNPPGTISHDSFSIRENALFQHSH